MIKRMNGPEKRDPLYLNYDFWKFNMLAKKTFMYHQITLFPNLSRIKEHGTAINQASMHGGFMAMAITGGYER